MNRWDFINEIIIDNGFSSYLEIGCNNDTCYSQISANIKTGVDPYKGGNVRCTSDDFFTFNTQIYDVIFINGLHIFDQVMRDIDNSLTFLSSGGIVLIHDCLPSNETMQMVPLSAARAQDNFTGGWTGDVWKALVEIRQRIDIDVITVNAFCGIGAIRKRANSNTLSATNSESLTWNDFVTHKDHLLNVYSLQEFYTWF